MSAVSFPRAFSQRAAEAPDAAAIYHGAETCTRAQLEARANRLANAYKGRGVKRGDLVAIALPNSIEFLTAALAVWKLGAVPQPLSSHLPELERRALLDLGKPALVIGVDVPPGFAPGANVSGAPLPDCTSPHAHAIASGGSSGRPKLILDAKSAQIDVTIPHYGIGPGAVVLVPGPLYHTGPFLNAREALLRGATVVLMGRFNAEEALQLIAKHKVTWVNFVPTMLHRIIRLPAEVRATAQLNSLQRVVSSGAPCAAWLMREWIEWIGAPRMFEAYGGTERIGGTLISGEEWLAHPGSVGRPARPNSLRIVGPSGDVLPPGEIGEIQMRPPGATYRYIGAPAAADGEWQSLGDLGYVDADGYLYIADRRSDLIISGGANVYPAEVEAALDSHPAVNSSAVIGLPDEDLGQRVHAIVQAAPAAEAELEAALRAHLEARLARYKCPRSYEFVAVPLRDDAGKVRRTALRTARI